MQFIYCDKRQCNINNQCTISVVLCHFTTYLMTSPKKNRITCIFVRIFYTITYFRKIEKTM